ncbi:hypothetical protein [Streptomyces bambusae]|uniref:Uncharacterized protein n=1 Tax=Streptomyces bambusae TaxID=1550616 RepID=A0ABS6Z7V9_9ACTN|nr:hypothetical protein [Streptomyces bambusae]MBW5483318.1 hypothetical protein [Streptomyces bambusae]
MSTPPAPSTPPFTSPPPSGPSGGYGALPSPAEPSEGPRRRLWAATGEQSGERVTNRLRRVVEGLPEWSPLPPGEQLIRRPGAAPGDPS